jgi:hypothetical protein
MPVDDEATDDPVTVDTRNFYKGRARGGAGRIERMLFAGLAVALARPLVRMGGKREIAQGIAWMAHSTEPD